jgi:hypothetical protein
MDAHRTSQAGIHSRLRVSHICAHLGAVPLCWHQYCATTLAIIGSARKHTTRDTSKAAQRPRRTSQYLDPPLRPRYPRPQFPTSTTSPSAGLPPDTICPTAAKNRYLRTRGSTALYGSTSKGSTGAYSTSNTEAAHSVGTSPYYVPKR